MGLASGIPGVRSTEPPRSTMTGIEDAAESGDAPEVTLAADSHGMYRIEDSDPVDASEVTGEDQFPKFGRFLQVSEVTRSGVEKHPDETEYVEIPQGLAQALVEAEAVTKGDEFVIMNVAKDTQGNWAYDVSKGTPE